MVDTQSDVVERHHPKRREVVTSIEEAASQIKDGMTIMIGGFATVNHSMPILRELIRRGVKDLTVIGSATAGLEIDVLIGAGCVKKVIAPYVGAELFCPIGHCWRKAFESGQIEWEETSEYLLYGGMYAASMGISFIPWRGGLGTSIPELNPKFKEFKDPIDGERYLAIPAMRADWAILHVGIADAYGNGQHLGARFGDRIFARAAERVMVTCEQVVSNQVIRQNPFRTSIPYADLVVEAPFGSHPFASHGFYAEDVEAINEYVAASASWRRGDPAALQAYLDKYVHGPADFDAYLDLFPASRLVRLQNQVPYRG